MRIYTLLTLMVFAISGRGDELLERQLSRVRTVSLSVAFFSEERDAYMYNWGGGRDRNRQNFAHYDFDGGDLHAFIRDRAHDVVHTLMTESGFSMQGRQLRVTVSLGYYDSRVTPVVPGKGNPTLLRRVDSMFGMGSEQAVLAREVFGLPEFSEDDLYLTFYAPLLQAVQVVRTGGTEEVIADVPFTPKRYGFAYIDAEDLPEIDPTTDTFALTFADKRAAHYAPDDLFTAWPTPHEYTVEPDAVAWTLITRNAIPGADYTFWWKPTKEAEWQVLQGVTADIHGEMRVSGIFGGYLDIRTPMPGWLRSTPVTDIFRYEGLAAHEYRHPIMDLASRHEMGDRRNNLFFVLSTDVFCTIDALGVDAFGFLDSEIERLSQVRKSDAIDIICPAR